MQGARGTAALAPPRLSAQLGSATPGPAASRSPCSPQPQCKIADPISTLFFSVFVLGSTFTILKDVFRVLMEGLQRAHGCRGLVGCRSSWGLQLPQPLPHTAAHPLATSAPHPGTTQPTPLSCPCPPEPPQPIHPWPRAERCPTLAPAWGRPHIWLLPPHALTRWGWGPGSGAGPAVTRRCWQGHRAASSSMR